MSTKKKTTQTIQYNKPALGVYEGLQPQIAQYYQQVLGPLMQTPWFLSALQFGQRQANLLGQRGMQNVTGNINALGFGGGQLPGYLGANIGRASRASSRLSADAFWNAYLGAAQMQAQGAQGAQGYQPLQMGQTTLQKTSGLGSFLPQLLGAGASAVMPLFGAGQAGGAFGLMGMGPGGQSLFQQNPLAWAGLSRAMPAPGFFQPTTPSFYGPTNPWGN